MVKPVTTVETKPPVLPLSSAAADDENGDDNDELNFGLEDDIEDAYDDQPVSNVVKPVAVKEKLVEKNNQRFDKSGPILNNKSDNNSIKKAPIPT